MHYVQGVWHTVAWPSGCFFLLSYYQGGHKKVWLPEKQSALEFDVKETLDDHKLMADVTVDSDSHRCSGQVGNFKHNVGAW